MAYKIGNYEFRTKEEYDEARKELSLVKQIRDKYNISDPKIASQLLATIERGDKIRFKTSIGKAFIEVLRKNVKVQAAKNSQVVKPANTTVPVKRERTSNTRNTGTRSSWQTDSQYRGARQRSTWEDDKEDIGRNIATRTNEPQQTETKKIKVKKKNWKVYHTKRNALIYLIVGIIGMFLSAAYMDMAGLNSHNMMSDPISAIFFWIYGIAATGLMVTLWFGFLRLIYKQASTKRLWGISGTILAMICIIAVSLTGVGAVSLMIVPKAIRYFWPTDDDLGLMEVEIEVPVASKTKAKKMFDQFEVTGFKEITEEEYIEYLKANKEDF